MKIVEKKYEIYKFEELDDNIQKKIFDFIFETSISKKLIGECLESEEIYKGVRDYIMKICKNNYYFKNGNIANIKD